MAILHYAWLPYASHLEVLGEALVCRFPNQNQVANGHKRGDHEEICALLIRMETEHPGH